MRKLTVITAIMAVVISSQSHAVQFNERQRINQRIGGGEPLDRTSSFNVNGNAGASWNMDLSCSDMSLNAEMLGSFSSGAFKQLQSSLLGSLQSALNPISLMGYALQKANPDLYDSLMNGSFMASDSYLSNLANCQSMQNWAYSQMPEGSLKSLSVGEEYTKAVKTAASRNYSLSSLLLSDSSGGSYDGGKNGVTFGGVSGQGAAGKPIEVVKYTSKVGFNALAGRSATASSSLPSSSTLGMATYFRSPAEANSFIETVVGETNLYTDSDEEARQEKLGRGAKLAYSKRRDETVTNLTSLVRTNVRSIRDSDLQEMSTPGVNVSRNLVLALQQIHPNEREAYINELASDIAISKTYGQLLTAVRIIDAGLKDKSVSNVEAVRNEALHKRELLIQEMDLLERELRFNKELSGGAPMDIMRRANLENSGTTTINGSVGPVNVSGAN